MDLRKLLSLTRKCIDTYGLIEKGDHIAVGVSGGKDSLTLLLALHELRKFYPVPYRLSAITVDLGFDNMDLSPVKAFCEKEAIPYEVVDTNIADILFEIRKEKNPCALCAKLRKGALNDKAKEMGVNKIAYAHHRNDLLETVMMALLYEGRYYTFSPLTYLDRSDLYVIRPFIMIEEKDIISFAAQYGLPVCKNPCPMDGYTKRQYIKELLARIYEENPGSDRCLYKAVLESHLPGWPEAREVRRISHRAPADADDASSRM